MYSTVSRTLLWSTEHLVQANVDATQSLSRIDLLVAGTSFAQCGLMPLPTGGHETNTTKR